MKINYKEKTWEDLLKFVGKFLFNPFATSEALNRLKAGQTPTYKKYVALLNQKGTASPVATILENTIGEVVLKRAGIGRYIIASNKFIEGKTAIKINNHFTGKKMVAHFLQTDNYRVYELMTFNLKDLVDIDGVLSDTLLEIVVYN